MTDGLRWFRILVIGHAISSYGTYLNMVALSLFAYHVTGSALSTGLFLALRLISAFATGLVAGRVASRLDRKRVLVGADLAQAIMLIVLLLAPLAAQRQLLYVVAAATGICSTLSSVALRSAIPEIVGPQLRVRANTLLVTGRSLAMVAGFASAGLVIAQWGYPAAIGIDAASFLTSAAILALLPIRTRAVADTEPDTGFRAAQRAAFGYLRLAPVLLAMISLRAVDGFGSASHNVGLPVYSTLLDPEHPATFMARFWAVWAVGNILAQQALNQWVKRTGRDVGERAFGVGVCLMSAAFILTFAGLPAAVTIAVALFAGAADGFTETAYTSRLQAVPDAQRGYVFGFSAMAENVGFGGGMILAAAALEAFAPLPVVTVFHGAAILLAIGFLTQLWFRARRRRHAPAPAGALPGAGR